MFDVSVKIISNQKVNDKYYKLSFYSSELAKNVLPGQFMQVQIMPAMDPFLRRPFSYYRVHNDDTVEILYEVLGHGTFLLTQKPVGSELKILGPLGKGFTSTKQSKKRVLIAGGIGVPPLVYFSEKNKVDYLIIGAKSKAEILPETELNKTSGEILFATNDGSYGKKGFVTVLLEDLLKKHSPDELFIQMCGPKPMMQAVIDIAQVKGIEGEASLDEDMACGVGACLGCMVNTDKGLVPSCVEGPIFSFNCIKQRLI